MTEETQKLNSLATSAFVLKANKANALSAIIRLCADLERREMGAVVAAMRDYIRASDEADAEFEREVSETAALIGAAQSATEAQLLMSQLLTFMRSGRRPNRSPKPLRKFAIVSRK